MILDQLNKLAVEQQVLTLHVEGTFVSAEDRSNELVHTCYWQGYVAEIFCRSEEGQWVPYTIHYDRTGGRM